MQTIAVPRDRSPILPLTSARFPAAVYVVLLHSVLWSKSVSTSTWIERFIRNGYIAVSFFLPVFALVIFGLVNIRGWLALLLSHKYLVLLGESSYAMYLLHWPLYSYMSHMCPITNLPTWILYWTTLVVISIMALFLLERPARRGILAIAKIRPAIIQEEEQVAPITFG